MTILKLEKITKVIQKNKILHDITFPVQQGDIFAFLGINGAGKSTTMNIISTLKQQSSGNILFFDQPYNKQIRKDIGVVFQDNVLDDDLSVLENLYHRGSLYYANKKELTKAIQEVIDLLHLNSILHKRISYCSGGEKRLASIARSILPKPKLLILDEPTTGLDVHIRKQIWDVITTLNKQYNMTIFFTSHYMEEALHANQIGIIHKGKVVKTQTLSSFLSNQQYTLSINNEVISTTFNSAEEAILALHHTNKIQSFSFQQPSIDDLFMKELHAYE